MVRPAGFPGGADQDVMLGRRTWRCRIVPHPTQRRTRPSRAYAAASGFDTSSSDLPSAAVPQIPPTTAATSISTAPRP